MHRPILTVVLRILIFIEEILKRIAPKSAAQMWFQFAIVMALGVLAALISMTFNGVPENLSEAFLPPIKD